jgi:hypothetical protein
MVVFGGIINTLSVSLFSISPVFSKYYCNYYVIKGKIWVASDMYRRQKKHIHTSKRKSTRKGTTWKK